MGKGGAGLITTQPVLSKKDRIARFGIECADELEWRNWQPGGEYVRNLVVKNVSQQIQKISYRLPASKVFSMGYPVPLKLSPGMSYPIRVTFQPLEQTFCSDVIEFTCSNGTFWVRVTACLPAVGLQVTDSVAFGNVTVAGTARRCVKVWNTGELPVSCSWQVASPFTILPASTMLAAGASGLFEVSFTPQHAAAYEAVAGCLAEGGATSRVQLTGSGRYPFLAVDHAELDFSEVLVGEEAEQATVLWNRGEVAADFDVVPTPAEPSDNVFRVVAARGTLAAGQAAPLSVVYTPATAGTFSCQSFQVLSSGGNKAGFTVKGTAMPPAVSLSTSSLSFGSLEGGASSSRVLYLHNACEVPAFFELAMDAAGVFGADRVRGSIAAGSTAHVTLAFQPTVAANYWKRVTVLIKDGPALFLDLLGSCFTDTQRPPPLSHAALQHFMAQAAAARSLEQQQILLEGGEVPDIEVGSGHEGAHTPEGWQALFHGTDLLHAISLDSTLLDFGSQSRLKSGEHRTLTVTNRTNVKLTAFIAGPLAVTQQQGRDAAAPEIFQVFPDQLDLRPNSTAVFRVTFRPPADGQYYTRLLDVVAYVKAQRSFRLVGESAVLAPFTTTLQVVGNTFLHQHEEAEVKMELSSSRLSFQPCLVGQAAHQTLMLMNNGDTAMQFDVQGLALAPQFACTPSRGVLQPQSWQLVAFQFRAAEAGRHSARLSCVLNNSQRNALPLLLTAAVGSPDLTCDAAGTVMFKPTCLGASTQRALTLHNPSCIAAHYQWDVPQQLQPAFSVQPPAGVLRGNERRTVIWQFTPDRLGRHDGQVRCLLVPAQLTAGLASHESAAEPPSLGSTAATQLEPELTEAAVPAVSLKLVGKCTKGAITLEPSSIHMGTVAVGFPAARTVTLLNQSDGTLRYHLSCVAVSSGDLAAAADGAAASAEERSGQMASPAEAGVPAAAAAAADEAAAAAEHLVIEEPQGLLPARAYKTLRLTLTPRRRHRYSLQLQCRTATAVDGSRAGAASQQLQGSFDMGAAAVPVCADIAAFATYPALMVADASSHGLSKPFVWEQMSCSDLNRELAAELNEAEVELRSRKLDGTFTTAGALSMLQPFRLELGADAWQDETREVKLQLRNPGELPLFWDVQAMHDIGAGLEMENWIEDSQPTNAEERLQEHIQEHRLLDIVPRAGRLAPGATCCVSLSHRNKSLGEHQLSLLLFVRDSKMIHLYLTGATLPRDSMRLAMKSHTMTLAPTPIGDAQSPVQSYLLRNGGPAAVPFSLDVNPLARMTAENYGFEVLKLVGSPQGVVPAGGVAVLRFVFRPLEAKLHEVMLPIKLADGQLEHLRVVGRGYHPEHGLQAVPAPAQVQEAEAAQDLTSWPGFASDSSLQLPGSLLTMSEQSISFGAFPITTAASRLLVLSCTAAVPITFQWQIGVFSKAAGVMDGQLEMDPACGELQPGESCICKLTYQAGLQPELFQGEVTCVARAAAEEQTHRGILTELSFMVEEAAVEGEAADNQPEVNAAGTVAVVSHPWWKGAAEEAAGLGMAGTQEEPNHKDSPVSISHNDRRPSEPGIASPRSALLSTRGGRNAPVSRGASLSAGLRQSLSPNGSLRSTWRRQQHHQPRATMSAAGRSHPSQSPRAGRRNLRQSVSQGPGFGISPRSRQDALGDSGSSSPSLLGSTAQMLKSMPRLSSSGTPITSLRSRPEKPTVLGLGETLEEVVELDPGERPDRYRLGTRLTGRLPVHMSLTKATLQKLEPLQSGWATMQQAVVDRGVQQEQSEVALPRPQVGGSKGLGQDYTAQSVVQLGLLVRIRGAGLRPR